MRLSPIGHAAIVHIWVFQAEIRILHTLTLPTSIKICTVSPERQQWCLILNAVSANFKWPSLTLRHQSIKENARLKVGFCEQSCAWGNRVFVDAVASEACVVRQSSEAAPPPPE